MSVIKIGKININIDLKKIKAKIRSAKRVILVGGLALCGLIIILTIYYWRFSNYKVEFSDVNENTLVYSYCSVNGNMLKYASDSAYLVNSKNETLWSVEYEMGDPEVDICSENVIIYDKGGTNIVICKNGGKTSEFRTDIPIVKAEVSSIGTVAALLDDESTAELDYFDTDGSLIATVRTTMSDDGYPMDIALSDDAMTMAVSYLTFNNGAAVSNVYFYSFDAAGQEASDNITGKFSYENEIIPEVDFLSAGKFAAFGTDMIALYQSSESVEEINFIETEDDMKSVFVNDKYFGYAMQGNEYTGSEIIVFDSSGKEKSRIITDMSYTSIEMNGDRIIMYNRNELAVYSAAGVVKFDGAINALIREIRYFGGNRFALAATDGYYVIRLC